MRRECSAGLPSAGDNVDDTSWKPSLLEQGHEIEQRRGRMLAWFEDERVTHGQGGAYLARRKEQGGVPPDDSGTHPDRLAQPVVEDRWRVRDYIAQPLVGEARVVVVPLGEASHLPAHLANQLPRVEDLGLCQRLGVRRDQICQATKHRPSLRLTDIAPSRIG